MAALGQASARQAHAADTIRWVSPRGTIEVLDDYPYWVGKKFGYFGDIETTLEPGPVGCDGHASSSSTRTRPMSASRRPACSRSALAQGIPLVSVFHMGGADVFDFAFRKGEKPDRPQGRSKARRSCSAAPAGSRSAIRC